MKRDLSNYQPPERFHLVPTELMDDDGTVYTSMERETRIPGWPDRPPMRAVQVSAVAGDHYAVKVKA